MIITRKVKTKSARPVCTQPGMIRIASIISCIAQDYVRRDDRPGSAVRRANRVAHARVVRPGPSCISLGSHASDRPRITVMPQTTFGFGSRPATLWLRPAARASTRLNELLRKASTDWRPAKRCRTRAGGHSDWSPPPGRRATRTAHRSRAPSRRSRRSASSPAAAYPSGEYDRGVARRAHSRLADRHARRRKGARSVLRDLPRRRPVHAGPRAGHDVADHRAATRAHVADPVAALRRHGCIANTCRCSRSAVEQFDLDGYDLVHQHQPLRRQVGGGDRTGAAPLLLPDADALRVGPVRRLFRAGAGRDDWATWCCGRCWRRLARWDRATEGRVHRYLAISQYVARRIALYYNRQSTLVYPPVDTEFYTPGSGRPACSHQPKFLVVSALVPYKRVDLAMMAARQAGVGH